MGLKRSDEWASLACGSKISVRNPVVRFLLLVVLISGVMWVDVGRSEEVVHGYLGPWQVRATPNGASVFVLCKDAAKIAVIDVASQQVTRWINVPADSRDFVISSDGKVIYVAAGVSNGIVAEIKGDDGTQVRQIPVGHTPGGLALSKEGRRIYVCNRFDNTVSVIDLAAGREEKRLTVTREPVAAALTPDEKRLFVANLLPLDRCDSYDVAAVVSCINTSNFEVHPIRLPNGSTDVHGLTISADGKWVYVVHVLARYQMPTTQLERGWMNTNALTVIDAESERVFNTVLLDDVDLGAALPWAVVCSSDGHKLVFSHAATDEISVINIPAVLEKLAKLPPTPEAAQAAGLVYDGSQTSLSAADVPNDLSFLVGLRERIPLYGLGPYDYLSADPEKIVKGARGLALVGSKVFIATYFGDLVTVVDLNASKYRRLSYVPLGPKPVLTKERLGELYFHDASLCFQHWQSCATCHPDGRIDGLNWDLLNDGLGTPKNNKSLLLAHQTPPSMWEGVRATAEEAVRSGIRHIQFAVRPDEDAQAIDAYLKSLRPVPSPHLVNGQLSESARRGRELFFSERLKCHHCHPEPLYTDLKKHNVGSRGPLDRSSEFDTPTLIEVWRTAPYMHDGHYLTLEELFREGKHGETAGSDVGSLTDQELHDLCEFVRSL